MVLSHWRRLPRCGAIIVPWSRCTYSWTPRNRFDLGAFIPDAIRTNRPDDGHNRGLSGHHIIAVALDAYMKGYRDFDVGPGLRSLQEDADGRDFSAVAQRATDLTRPRVSGRKGSFRR